jgi:hypothetical protein
MARKRLARPSIYECQLGTKGNRECVFRITRTDPITGKPVVHGCMRFGGKPGRDFYNLFPETDKEGYITFQPTNPTEAPFWRLGESPITMESLTDNNNGRTYLGFRDIPSDSTLHPLYTHEERNIPTKSYLSDDDVGEIMGDDNPALVNQHWGDIRFIKKDTVEKCKPSIFGVFLPSENMVMSACLRSHVGEVPNWVNYTKRTDKSQKELLVCYATHDEIRKFCNKYLGSPASERLFDALVLISKGTYINIWSLLRNNFVDKSTIKKIQSAISSVSIDSLYKTEVDIKAHCEFFHLLEKAEWKSSYVDENGNKIDITQRIPREKLRIYKENLLNFILNSPDLKKCLSVPKLTKSFRYWHVVALMRVALKEGILNPDMSLPQWLVDIIKQKDIPYTKLFGKMMSYKELPHEYKGEFHDVQYLRLNQVDDLYPGMRIIKKEVDHKILGSQGWYQFCEILKCGRIWSINEIKNAFERFVPSWMQDDPSIFLEWVNNIADLPFEDVISMLPDELDSIRKKTGCVTLDFPKIELMEKGAISLTDGSLSEARGFAINIMSSILPKIDEKTGKPIPWRMWESWEDWNAYKAPISNWYEATARIKLHKECNHDTFWARMARMGGYFKDKARARKLLTEETMREAMESHEEGLSDLANSVDEVGLNTDDLFIMNGIDSRNNEEGRDGLWLGQE